jgi:hypothetical protein
VGEEGSREQHTMLKRCLMVCGACASPVSHDSAHCQGLRKQPYPSDAFREALPTHWWGVVIVLLERNGFPKAYNRMQVS